MLDTDRLDPGSKYILADHPVKTLLLNFSNDSHRQSKVRKHSPLFDDDLGSILHFTTADCYFGTNDLTSGKSLRTDGDIETDVEILDEIKALSAHTSNAIQLPNRRKRAKADKVDPSARHDSVDPQVPSSRVLLEVRKSPASRARCQ